MTACDFRLSASNTGKVIEICSTALHPYEPKTKFSDCLEIGKDVQNDKPVLMHSRYSLALTPVRLRLLHSALLSSLETVSTINSILLARRL